MKNLYNVRSKCVHGSHVSHEALLEHVSETKDILANLLIKIIENNRLFDEKDIDKLLFNV